MSRILRITNCQILRNHKIEKEDLWIENGKFIDPIARFYNSSLYADETIDAQGLIVAPGYIDIQLNGAFGIDFSSHDNVNEGVSIVSKGLFQYGVTSFLPTLVSSHAEVYHRTIPQIKLRKGAPEFGAEILGLHLEGPFICEDKKGAHEESCLQTFNQGMKSFEQIYGNSLDNVKIVTLAPELPGSLDVIPQIANKGIIVSIGHSNASINLAEESVHRGASLITHLFNAMVQFHHRDPGLFGLLGSNNHRPFYSIIPDGIHCHPNAIKIAYYSHPNGSVIVTDAMGGLGLGDGNHSLGTMSITISHNVAYVHGTNTLAGSVCPMDECVQKFWKFTDCSVVEALEAATLHPAQVLGIEKKKGTLDVGADADFIFLDSDLNVKMVFSDGRLAWSSFL